MRRDSVDKIVTSYFACITREVFTYKGKQYDPKPLRVSPLLLRGYTCPERCGGCCNIRFSLDYLPQESAPIGVLPREIDFNGRSIKVWSDMQNDHSASSCKHLRGGDGRCGIYLLRPFSCDFELIRFLTFAEDSTPNTLTQKLFGRGWNMLRIDGERGALCEMTPPTEETISEVLRKLQRLQDWATHFHLRTWVPEIMKMIRSHRLREGAVFSDSPKKGLSSKRINLL